MLSPKEIITIDATILAGILILLTIVTFEDELKLENTINEAKFQLASLNGRIDFLQTENEITDESLKKLEIEILTLYSQNEAVNKSLEEGINSIFQLNLDMGQVEYWINFYNNTNVSDKKNMEIYENQKLILINKINPLLEKRASYENELEILSNKIEIKENEIKKLTISKQANEEAIEALYSQEKQLNLEIDTLNYDNQANAPKLSSFLKTPQQWAYYLGLEFSLSGVFAVFASYYEKNPNHVNKVRKLMIASYAALAAGFFMFILIFLWIGIL